MPRRRPSPRSRGKTSSTSPVYLQLLGAGSRIILVFILNDEAELMLVESHDLPADEEWGKMERDEMWRTY